MGSLNPHDRVVASPHAVLREEFDDWAVLFHSLTGEAKGVDPVGVAVWKAIDGRRTLAEIAALIQAACEDAPSTVLEDTIAFVRDLHRHLFVEVVPERSPS